jgi:hypothetical protein
MVCQKLARCEAYGLVTKSSAMTLQSTNRRVDCNWDA